MAGTFTVFNIGTSHTRAEPNNTIACLYNDCTGDKFINDGAGTGGNFVSNGLGVAQGLSMDPRCRAAVDAILRARPGVVNLVGHSRGAVMCHMIANDLATLTDPAARAIQQVNLILLDPVNMSVHTQRGGKLRGGVKLGYYVSIVMENVNGMSRMTFPSMTVKPLGPRYLESMIWLHMPGTHGSGTQPLTSAIGRATLKTIQWHLEQWGTRFMKSTPTAGDLCEAYASIHLENEVSYDKKGLVKARMIDDDPKGMSTSQNNKNVTAAWQKVGRVKDIAANYERMNKAGNHVENLRDSPYFFNTFHLSAFKAQFPGIFALSANYGQKDYGRDVIDREIREIETRYPKTEATMKKLGML